MKNYISPTIDEIWAWAWDENAMEPSQDWDIIIRDLYPNEYVKIAMLPHCPGRSYFLSILYLFIGDLYRVKNIEKIKLYLNQHRGNESRIIQEWVKNVDELISGNIEFSYSDWCAGGLAKKSLCI
jgi:hypothetical protein